MAGAIDPRRSWHTLPSLRDTLLVIFAVLGVLRAPECLPSFRVVRELNFRGFSIYIYHIDRGELENKKGKKTENIFRDVYFKCDSIYIYMSEKTAAWQKKQCIRCTIKKHLYYLYIILFRTALYIFYIPFYVLLSIIASIRSILN